MSAIIQDLYSRQRQPLHKIIPLNTPMSLVIEPTTFCNLKCDFCLHSLPAEDRLKHDMVFSQMSIEQFNLLAEQLTEFPQKIKSIAFVGIGEPLLHKDLPQMVQKLKESDVGENIIVTTNGTLLSHDLSDQLINAGLDTLFVSLNGLSSEDYKSVCGVNLDFENFVEQLAYYRTQSIGGKHKIKIKTFDFVVDNDERKKKLTNIFGNIADEIGIERLGPRYTDANISRLKDINETKSRYLGINSRMQVCSNTFYRAMVRVDGGVNCCGCYNGKIIGNISSDSIASIWNGSEHKTIQKNVLKQNYADVTRFCATCSMRSDFAFEEDNLEPYVDEIYERITRNED